MKSTLVPMLLLVTALAGCASPEGVDEDPGTDGGDPEPLQLQLPEWQVGDWWTYATTFGDHTLVVSGDGGDSWTMDTDHAGTAFFHDVSGGISYLGDIRKSDLAGSQPDGPVRFFHWPLEHNKEWTATWDGMDFDMVSHVDADNGVAHIVASLDGTAVNTIVYDASVGWFRSISWGDPETGEEQFRMDLTDSGTGFSGELVRVDAVLASSDDITGLSGAVSPLIDASGASDDADAYLLYSATCETGSYAFGVGTYQSIPNLVVAVSPGEDQGFTDVGAPCPRDFLFAGVIGEAPANGDQWGAVVESASPDLEISYQLYWRNFERITL